MSSRAILISSSRFYITYKTPKRRLMVFSAYRKLPSTSRNFSPGRGLITRCSEIFCIYTSRQPTQSKDLTMLSKVFTAILCAQAAWAYSSPPSGAITVGSSGTYSTLSKALADTSSSVYFIYSGTYTGQTLISRSNIKIYGQTSTADSYTGNSTDSSLPQPRDSFLTYPSQPSL